MTNIGAAAGENESFAPVPDRLDVSSIGLFICPNRNLTTLTAAMLSLHPHVQVLNHGFERLQAAGILRFLDSGRDDDLENFVRGAIGMSAGGRRGDYGGSILLSHAYDRPALRAAYEQHYGDTRLKPDIKCLVWKDGARLSEYVKANNIDPVRLAERLPRLRFISPMREPIAHLRSLQRYYADGLPPYIRGSLSDLMVASVAIYILAAHADFLAWRERRPAQFFAFSEDDLGPQGAASILRFLDVANDETWLQMSARFFVNDGPRIEAASEQGDFESLLNDRYANFGLLRRWYRHIRATQRTLLDDKLK